MKLRSALVLLVVATAVPVILFGAYLSTLVIRHERDNFIAAVKDRNRAFMSAVDSEVSGSIATLKALTAEHTLMEGDLRRFHAAAVRVLGTQPHWLNIVLFSTDGRQLMNTLVSWGTPLPDRSAELDTIERAVATRLPAVGNMILKGPLSGRGGIAVRVPVIRDGSVAYVLSAILEPGTFDALIRAQQIPKDWVAGLVDANGLFIARVPQPRAERASEEYLAKTRAMREGWYRGHTIEGWDTFTAHLTSAFTGWSVGVAMPEAVVLGAERRAMQLALAGLLGCLALAVVIALALGRRIAEPIARLSRGAKSIGESDEPLKLSTSIGELKQLAVAFDEASKAIVARRRIARREREVRERNLKAFSVSPNAVAVIRASDSSLLDVNQSWLDLFGFKKEQVLGRTLSELGRYTDAGDEANIRQRIEDNGLLRDYEISMRGASGPLVILVSAVFVDINTERCIYCFMHDVTGHNRAIQEMKRAEVALREADRRKDEFLATLAHELRNPLAPIRNAVQIMNLRGSQEPSVRTAREIVERQVRHMVRLIDDLLDVSRITRGKMDLRKERIAIDAVLEQALETARPHMQGREVKLSLLPSSVFLEGDPVRLAQVFANLLNNASKYTDRGGHIAIEVKRSDDTVEVAVIDTGIGLESRDLSRIFDMFVQVPSGREASLRGLGIGLSLARGIVEMHGGRIEAASEGLGRGSRFTVSLPALAERVGRVDGPGTVLPKWGRSRRILVADDNRDSLESLAMLLRSLGNDVETASDGREALQVAERWLPEVVLLDIGMPEMDGYECCRRLRAQSSSQDITILALTGWGQDEDRRKSREAGFDGHLVKPVEFDALVQLIEASEVMAG